MQSVLVDQDCIQEEIPVIDTEIIAKTIITLFQSYMPDEIVKEYEHSTQKLFNPNEYENQEERNRAYQEHITKQLAYIVAMVCQTLFDETDNNFDIVSRRLDLLEKIRDMDLPEAYKYQINELIRSLIYCYFDENGKIKLDNPEFDECNLAAEFVLVQFLKNIFGDQSYDIIQALNMPMINSVLNNLDNKAWVRQHQMIARETPQEGSRDSIAHTPYSRLNKIEKERINNCRIIEQSKNKERKK